MKQPIGIVILISFLLFSCSKAQQKILTIKDGTIDLVNHDFDKEGTVIIKGEVNYYPSQLLTVDEIHSGEFNPVLVKFPDKLSDQLPNKDAKGYGTYHFRIRLPNDEHSYGLFIQGIFTSYKLYVGEGLEDKLGKVGTTMLSQQPMVRPEIVNLHLEDGFNDVILQVSNFYENEAQISFPLEIGDMHSLYRRNYKTYGYDFSFSFLYIILFASFLLLFFFHRKTNYLIFSFYCFVLAYRFLIKNSKFLLEIVDSGWTLFYKTEYVTYYLTSSCIAILLCGIFKMPRLNSIRICIAVIAILASMITFFTSIPFFTSYSFIYHYYSILLVLFCLFITVFYHLIKPGNKQMLLVIGVVIYAACFLYDIVMSILYYKESYYFNWGLAILTLIMAIDFVRSQFFSEKKFGGVESIRG